MLVDNIDDILEEFVQTLAFEVKTDEVSGVVSISSENFF